MSNDSSDGDRCIVVRMMRIMVEVIMVMMAVRAIWSQLRCGNTTGVQFTSARLGDDRGEHPSSEVLGLYPFGVYHMTHICISLCL